MHPSLPNEQYYHGETISFKHSRGDIGILPKMFHPHVELFLLIDGDVEYVGENGRYWLLPYTLLIIPSGVYHQFIVTGGYTKYERYVLELDAGAFPASHFGDLTMQQRIFHLSGEHPIVLAFHRLRQYCTNAFLPDRAPLSAAVATEILALIRLEQPLPDARMLTADRLSATAMNYIHSHLDEALKLTQIAEACYVAPSTLSHVFREDFGISVMQYIKNKKMAYARQLILEGLAPGEVCRRCGYAEYSTFFRAYVKEYGIPPTART